MKGIVFTQFMESVESLHGYEMVDRMITRSGVIGDGSYTSTGTYDHKELLRMVKALSSETDTPFDELLVGMGIELFDHLKEKCPVPIEFFDDSFAFLATLNDVIHRNVMQLYPDAEVPDIEFKKRNDVEGTLVYRSSRPFAKLAEGLLLGCSRHFGGELDIRIEQTSLSDACNCTFSLRMRS